MESIGSESVTALLSAARDGDAEAFDRLYGQIYEELRRLARMVRRGKAGETMSTTALVHEAYIQLVPSRSLDWQDRTHFLRVAARAMRQVLVQTARRKMAQKRGGNVVTVSLNDEEVGYAIQLHEVIDLEDALVRLEQMDQRQAQIIECRVFAGLTVEDTAKALGVGESTVKRDYRAARAWLTSQLSA